MTFKVIIEKVNNVTLHCISSLNKDTHKKKKTYAFLIKLI